jgi:hypothetical protein
LTRVRTWLKSIYLFLFLTQLRAENYKKVNNKYSIYYSNKNY